MTTHRLDRAQVVARPRDDVFRFFSRAENLERITPPWLHFRLTGAQPVEIRAGAHIPYRLRLHGIPLVWVSLIEAWEQGRRFVDRQVRGPFRMWRHEHEFFSVPGGTRVEDRVDFVLPGGHLGDFAGLAFIRRELDRIFDYRREAVAKLLG